MKVVDINSWRKQEKLPELILIDEFEQEFYEQAKECAAIFRDQLIDWQNIEDMMLQMVKFAVLEKHSEEAASRK
jgi:hypothetical protein